MAAFSPGTASRSPGSREYGREALQACPVLEPADMDTDALDEALVRHVHAGRVDYPGLARSPAFAGYLADIARVRRGAATDADWLAFLINSYNALAIGAVLDGLSPASLLGRLRFFLLRRHRIGGRYRTLYGLEHAELMAMGEPRIHFAIVCASASCPPLRPAAYRPATLPALLDADAREFVNDPRRNRFDPATGIARLSRIFRWYRGDFGAGTGALQAWLAGYVADPEVADRLAAGVFRIEYLRYDWSLNGTPPDSRRRP